MTEPLAPCPFCGAAGTAKSYGGTKLFVDIKHDKKCIFWNDASMIPVETWNRRASDSRAERAEAENASLRKQLEEAKKLIADGALYLDSALKHGPIPGTPWHNGAREMVEKMRREDH